VHGASAITAITAQNTTMVSDILELPVDLIRAQIDRVFEDLRPAAAKTGMLFSSPIIRTVAGAARDHTIKQLVIDPVMVAKSGARLLQDDAVDALRHELLSLAAVITPNLPEAEVLLGHPVQTLDQRRQAARELLELGPRAVVVKGGHAAEDAIDVFFDGDQMEELSSPRIDSKNTHGSGCAFSAAIAAGLAQGMSALDAARRAKGFITSAIEAGLDIGSGPGPVNPMFRIRSLVP
jgi:hydroxymethylpyrimidine/phosphomethylpyrimidine kinase